MKFAWDKYEELDGERTNTLQIFINNICNLKCDGCFARNVMGKKADNISMNEYVNTVTDFLEKGGKQINLLGGEPLLHPLLREFIKYNKEKDIKTVIYTNGSFIGKYNKEDFDGAKLRISIYCKSGETKGLVNLSNTDIPFDICYMVSKSTTLEEMLNSAVITENEYGCNTFFISSIRELDNPRKEFFDDTDMTMPVLEYKELVHNFLNEYNGDMDIHISNRGVFESTKVLNGNKCKFANYFCGGKIIQCPYDIVNMKFQDGYEFDERFCQHNNSCLMTKLTLRKIKKGLDLNSLGKRIKDHFDNMTPEEMEEAKEFFRDKNPKGWINIEVALPMMKAIDIRQGYTEYKVKDKDGNEFISIVSDHNMWYNVVKKEGIIKHWWND